VVDDLAERATPEFYREQGLRLTLLAADCSSAEGRLALLEMAAVFQKLAERSAANRNWAIRTDADTA
jgi:hypothetical protein